MASSPTVRWTDLVKIRNENSYNAQQRSRIIAFFNRLEKSPAGQILLSDISARRVRVTSTFLGVGVTTKVIPLTIGFTDRDIGVTARYIVQPGKQVVVDGHFGAVYGPDSALIEVNTDAAFGRQWTTSNVNGQPQKLEQVLLHEILHFLLSNNPGFRGLGENIKVSSFSTLDYGDSALYSAHPVQRLALSRHATSSRNAARAPMGTPRSPSSAANPARRRVTGMRLYRKGMGIECTVTVIEILSP